MKRRLTILYSGLLLLFAATNWASAARGDQALVVGVNNYPNIPHLRGSINDATAMGDMLKSYGFQVTELLDKDATYKNIVDNLESIRQRCKPSERFVFYYAGHGTRKAGGRTTVRGFLLPFDTRLAPLSNVLDADALNQQVRGIGRSQTILLDSCFSGAMTRWIQPGELARYCPLPDQSEQSRDVPVTGADPIAAASSESGACYFTAARENEASYEGDFNGVRHGYFTYYLLSVLKNHPDRWSSAQREVCQDVQKLTDDRQEPSLKQGFEDVRPFESRQAQPPTTVPAPPRTLWDEYCAENADPSRIQLTMIPNKTTLHIGQDHFAFKVNVGSTKGYLVVLERDVTGALALLYPESRNPDDGRVDSGQTVNFPTEGDGEQTTYHADAVGTERIKAILFPSREQALPLLNAFPASNVIGKSGVSGTRILRKDPLVFHTSDLIFEVVPQTPDAGSLPSGSSTPKGNP